MVAAGAERPGARASTRSARDVGAERSADTPYAGLITRAIAFAIDAAIIDAVALVVGVLAALIVSVLPASIDHRAALVAVGGAAFGVWVVGYFTVFWCTTGQTPGNRVMRIRVRHGDGSSLRPRRAVVRLAGIVVAAAPLGLGFAPILVTERRRGLQDWLAGSVVQITPDLASPGPSTPPHERRP